MKKLGHELKEGDWILYGKIIFQLKEHKETQLPNYTKFDAEDLDGLYMDITIHPFGEYVVYQSKKHAKAANL